VPRGPQKCVVEVSGSTPDGSISFLLVAQVRFGCSEHMCSPRAVTLETFLFR
jgi:hypothetical protein